MIIFGLDGVLANVESRRHFIDVNHEKNKIDAFMKGSVTWTQYANEWKPDEKAYNEACINDQQIEASIVTMRRHSQHADIQIWTDRCESIRELTTIWLYEIIPLFAPKAWFDKNLKMRPIGDDRPQHELFAEWLDEYNSTLYPKIEKNARDGTEYKRKDPIEMVFESDPQTVKMYRDRGIFVFDCNQGKRKD